MLDDEIQKIFPAEGIEKAIIHREGRDDIESTDFSIIGRSCVLASYKPPYYLTSATIELGNDFVYSIDEDKTKYVLLTNIEKNGNVYKFIRNDGSVITVEVLKMKDLFVQWTGFFPNLCRGEWKLFINQEDLSHLIPEEKRTKSMHIEGASYLDFDIDLDDDELDALYKKYENGLTCEEWIEDNKDWLVNLPIDKERWNELYECFKKYDFVTNTCGGCL